MTVFFTIFLIDDRSCPLKDNENCLQVGTQFIASNITRVADMKNKTIQTLMINEKYTLPKLGWVISPYTTYHDEHLRYVRHFKGNLPYDYACFFIDVATERLNTMVPEKPIDIYAKKRWLRQHDIAKWVDSVLNDWVLNYTR